MRKISFKATGAAMIAAVTLTGMTAVPCYAGFTLPFIGGNSSSAVEDPELDSMFGRSLKEMTEIFDGMSEPYWNMGMTSSSNGQVTLISADSSAAQDGITQLQLPGSGHPYWLMGVDTGMTYSEAGNELAGKGFYCMPSRPVYYDRNGNYVALSGEDNDLTVTMSHITLGSHTDKTEVSQYMGENLRQLFYEGFDVGARTEGEDTVVEDGQVMFYARGQADDLGSLNVSKIVIKGTGNNCCLYGYQPGDGWDNMYPGMQEGGSGEWIDPSGNVLSMYASTDSADPQIVLYDPSQW